MAEQHLHGVGREFHRRFAIARGVAVQEVRGEQRDIGAPLAQWGKPDLDRVETKQRSEEHTSELQSQSNLVCRLLLEKKKASLYNTPVSSLVHNALMLQNYSEFFVSSADSFIRRVRDIVSLPTTQY